VRAGLVVSADHAPFRVSAAQLRDVHAGHSLQRQAAIEADGLEPRDGLGHVAVGVHHRQDAPLLGPQDDAPVERREEPVELLAAEHRAVVVRQVLGETQHVGRQDAADGLENREVVLAQGLVDPQHEFRLIVKGVEVRLDTEDLSREPEEPVDLELDDHLSRRLSGGHPPQRIELEAPLG